MTQTWALFVDAYRELKSKRLFWLVLMLSGLVVGVFACIGINKNGLTLLWFEIGDFGGLLNSDTVPPEQLYKMMFSGLGIKWWLSWIATILALVSTAGVIPDFIAGGAIELTLSKPISRLRLFFTKYLTSLLFVTMQVAIFSAASFLLIGTRGGAWAPGVFLAIPIVVVFYSYLFSVCALIGLVTRSTIAALLLTLLFWLFLFCLNAADLVIVQGREINAMRLDTLPARIERMERATATQLRKKSASEGPSADGTPPRTEFSKEELDKANPTLVDARRALERAEKAAPKWQWASRAAVIVKTVLPKTAETTSLLERALTERMEIPKGPESNDDNAPLPGWTQPMSRADQERLAVRMTAAFEQRSVAWVMGTSLGFEAIVLIIAGWVFVRRDF